MTVTIDRKQDPWGSVIYAEAISHIGERITQVAVSLPNMSEREERIAVYEAIGSSYEWIKRNYPEPKQEETNARNPGEEANGQEASNS